MERTVVMLLISLLSPSNQTIRLAEKGITLVSFDNWYRFNFEIETDLETDTVPWKYHVAIEAYAKKGEYQKAMNFYDLQFSKLASDPYSSKQIDSIHSMYTPISAVEYIVDQSKSNRLVIINEAHHNPLHRVFTRSLLQKMFDAGYRLLGLEALYNGEKGGTILSTGGRLLDCRDTLLNQRKYPVRETGTYTAEPEFGNLIRAALNIGYTVFSYEYPSVGSARSREIGQARNIQKVIEENPNQKIAALH